MRLSILATAFILAGAAPVAARTPPAPPPVQTAAPADAASPEAMHLLFKFLYSKKIEF